MSDRLKAIMRQVYPDPPLITYEEKKDGPYVYRRDEQEDKPRLHGVVNTHDRIPIYPPNVRSLSNSKIPKVFMGRHRFTSGKSVPTNWIEPMRKVMEASWVLYVTYKFAGECNDIVLHRESYSVVPPFEYMGVLERSETIVSHTGSAFQITPYYSKGDKLIFATCAHNIVPQLKKNNKLYVLAEIIACHEDFRGQHCPRLVCKVLKDGNVDVKAQVASENDYALLIAEGISSDDSFPTFLIPKPISSVINKKAKESIAEDSTDGYDHLLIGSPAPVSKDFMDQLNKQFRSQYYTAAMIDGLLAADNRSVSLGQVVDEIGTTYSHTSCTSPGSSGSACIVIEGPIFEKLMTPFPEILTFQGIHIGGGTLNYAFSVENEDFHSDYLEHVVKNLSDNQLEKLSEEQKKYLNEYISIIYESKRVLLTQ